MRRRAVKPRVVSAEKPVQVRTLATAPDTVGTRIEVRNTERGKLNDEFNARRVWTVEAGQAPRAEWLVMRRENTGKVFYALSNASVETPLT